VRDKAIRVLILKQALDLGLRLLKVNVAERNRMETRVPKPLEWIGDRRRTSEVKVMPTPIRMSALTIPLMDGSNLVFYPFNI
jgi:hypothetical protein